MHARIIIVVSIRLGIAFVVASNLAGNLKAHAPHRAAQCYSFLMNEDQHTRPTQQGVAVFTLPSGAVSINPRALEQIRGAVVKHLQASEHEFRTELIEELADADLAPIVDADSDTARVGLWTLQVRGDELRFVRGVFPRTRVMIFYYAVLSHDGSEWHVKRFGNERVIGR